MSNDITRIPWVLDSDGMIRTLPLTIKYAEFIPSAVGQSAILRQYDWGTNKSSQTLLSITVSGNDTLTDTVGTGVFVTANVAAGDAIQITATGTGNNIGTYLVKTRTNDTNIVIDDGGLTNDTTELYTFTIHTGITFHKFRTSGVTSQTVPDKFMPPQPVVWQNLAVDDISTGAIIYMYV